MQLQHFIDSQQSHVAQFWTDIWREMEWNDAIEGSDNIPDFLHFPEGFLLVITEGPKVLGCGGVKPIEVGSGIIKRFYLAPSLRGTGWSTKLLDEIITTSKQRRISKLVLDVYYTNLRAARFYEKHGFTRYEQQPIPEWEESHYPQEFFYYQRLI